MDKASRRLLRSCQRFLVWLIEEVPLWQYLAVYFAIVVILGWFYYYLTPYGCGLGQNSKPLGETSLLNGLYFSVVTVSSLGYGDLQPMGVSKVIACIEVLFGLAWMGIAIAKMTSRRLSYHVQRLFSADAQRRLEEFANRFETSAHELLEVSKALGRVYQKTPNKTDGTPQEKASALISLGTALTNLHAKATALVAYLSDETEQSNYFRIVPSDAVIRLGERIDKGLFLLGQLIIGLSHEARTEVFMEVLNRQRISDTLNSQKVVCGFVDRHATDEGVKKCFIQVLETCNRVPEGYVSIPREAAASGLPDQRLQSADEPEQPSLPNP